MTLKTRLQRLERPHGAERYVIAVQDSDGLWICDGKQLTDAELDAYHAAHGGGPVVRIHIGGGDK